MKSRSFVLVMILHISVGLCYAQQLADTMECADESCSETISEGEARLAYRPGDDKFLNLKKGDVVLVKSKNAGKKSHLWGGQVMGGNRFGFFPSSFIREYMVLVKSPKVTVTIQDFLYGRNPPTTEDVYSGLAGENQKIPIDKTKEQKLQDEKNDWEKGTLKDDSMEDNDKEHPLITPEDKGRSQQEPEQSRSRSIEEHPDDGNTTSHFDSPATELENVARLKEENLDGESKGVQDTTDKQLKDSFNEDGANDQRREEDGTVEEYQTSSDLEDSDNSERRHLDAADSKIEKDNSKQQEYASNQIAQNEQRKRSDANKQEATKMPPDIAVLLGTEWKNKVKEPSQDSVEKGKSDAQLDQQGGNTEASDDYLDDDEGGHDTQLDQEDEDVEDPLNEKDQDTQVIKKHEDSDVRREDLPEGEQEPRDSSGMENNEAETVPPPVNVDSSKGTEDGPFEDDVDDDFEEDYYDDGGDEVEEETLTETGDFPHESTKTDEKIDNGPTGQGSLDDDATQLENAYVQEERENGEKEKPVSTQQSSESDVKETYNMKQKFSSTPEYIESGQKESDPEEGLESHGYLLEGDEEENSGVKMENMPGEEGSNQGEDGKHQDQYTRDEVNMKQHAETSDEEKTHATEQEVDELDPASTGINSQTEHGGGGDRQDDDDIFKPPISEEGHDGLKDQSHTDSADHQHHSSNKHKENAPKEATPDGQQDVGTEPVVADSHAYEDTPNDKVNLNENTDASKVKIHGNDQHPNTEQEGQEFSQNFPNKEGEHERNWTHIDDDDVQHKYDQGKTHQGDAVGDEQNSANSDNEQRVLSDGKAHRVEERDIHHEEVGNNHDTAHGVDKGKTQFDAEPEHGHERKTHRDESENNLDADRNLVEGNMHSDEDDQHQAEQSKTRAEEHNIQHEEVGNDRDSALENDKENTQFDEESEHQAEERKAHPNKSGDDLDPARKLAEEKPQFNKENRDQAEDKEKILFHEKSKHQPEERKTHPGESGDGIDSVPKHVEEKKQSDKVDQHQVKDNKTRHDESGVDSEYDEDDDERTQSEKDAHEEYQQGRTHDDEVNDERDPSHSPEEMQVQYEQANVISGSNEHEVQARNINSKPQASVEIPVASNQDQQNVVPNERSESEEDVKSKGTVLQMEAVNLNQAANTVVNEQVLKPKKAYSEGNVVDCDETIDGKGETEKSAGWDRTLGGDNEEDLKEEDVLSESLIEGDVVEHLTVTPQPLGDEQTAPTTLEHGKTQPSETQGKLEKTRDEEPHEQGKPKSLVDEIPQQQQEEIERGNETKVGESGEITESMVKVPEVEYDIDSELPATEEMHVGSFWLRLPFVLFNLPLDASYILEPFFNVWVSLLPKEYHDDVHGVSWTIILSTFFVGFALIWLFTWRSRSLKTRQNDELILHNLRELKTQLANLSQEKVEVENELKIKENEAEIQLGQMATVSQEKDEVVNEKRGLEHSLQEFSTENEALKRDLQQLNHAVQEKDRTTQEILANSKQVEKSLLAQQEAIVRYEAEIAQLQGSLQSHGTSVKEAEASAEKFKERIKNLEKSKGETKREGRVMREQTEKLNATINELQDRLDAKNEEGEQKEQEIDVLKDCILQFKGAQEYLTDEGEDAESDDAIEKQKNKMKSMINVANVKTVLRRTEADKLQITYELEAERKSRFDIEAKTSELEALIQSDQAVKNKLEKDKQILESKLSVMQDFYAKREVEIQSKLGFEQSKKENNASMLEDQQKQHMEILQQLDAYKKMGEEAKHQYDGAERQHKQEILGFEKKAHDNWLACREAERKMDEAHKQMTQLQFELGDARQRLRDYEREPIPRPRPERHGPPGAPPPFGPPRRPPPPGMPGSPLHFRNGPPEADRRSPPPLYRSPPSPGGSIPGDRPPSRPASTHSLSSMDRRPRPGLPLGSGQPYPNPPGRSYADGVPPIRPPLRDLPPHARPPPGARMPSGPMTSSPYMERPTIPPSQSPGPRSHNFTQSSLHATPPHGTGEGLRNDGYQPPPEWTEPPPPSTGRGRDTGSSIPFRR